MPWLQPPRYTELVLNNRLIIKINLHVEVLLPDTVTFFVKIKMKRHHYLLTVLNSGQVYIRYLLAVLLFFRFNYACFAQGNVSAVQRSHQTVVVSEHIHHLFPIAFTVQLRKSRSFYMLAIFCAHYLKCCVNMVDFIFKKVSTVAQVK